MKILKPLFLFISIYAAFVGCSKKNDPAASVCYMATSTNAYGSTSLVSNYTYADNKVVSISKVSNNGASGTIMVTYNYSYDAQGRISSVTSTNPSYIETHTYDSQGNLTQIVYPTLKTIFTYNSSNQMVKKENYNAYNSSFVLNDYSTFTYPSTNTKNFSTATAYDWSGALTLTVTYVYDTKQNPEAVLFPNYPQPTNNQTQMTFQYPGTSTTYTLTFTYTYNANGFPLTAIQQDGSNTTTTYTYTNCK